MSIVHSCVVTLPASSVICTVLLNEPATEVLIGNVPSGSLAKPDRLSLAPEIVYEALLFRSTGPLGQVSVNVGLVSSILITSLLVSPMFPLESSERAVIVVFPSLVTLIGPVYLIHSVFAAPSSL